MNIAADISQIIGGLAEILAIVVCIDFLGTDKQCNVKVPRAILALIVHTAISGATLLLNNTLDNSAGFFIALLYAAKNIISLLIMYGHINLKIIYSTIFIDLTISFLASCVSCVSANMTGNNSRDVMSYVTLVIQAVVLFSLIILSRKLDAKKIVTVLRIIPKRIFALLLLALVCLSAMTSLVCVNTDDYKLKSNFLIAMVILLSIIFACIVISLFINVIAKQYFTSATQLMEKQVELQISHYDSLVKTESEISKFRHDYNNHLRSILSLIRMNECAQAEEYIEKLQKIKYKTDTVLFYTGNRLADAILSDKSSALGDNCRIEYSGIIPSSIENVDLCVILTNALDNAIEACQKIQTHSVISVQASKQQGYFVLSIKNPTACTENYNSIPSSTKSDSGQHGIGLHNVESTVKKYDGQMKVRCENGFFELMLTMKI